VLKDESLEDSANLLDYPACPASLDILKISMPPAVKLAAVFSVRPTLDPDIIAQEIVRFPSVWIDAYRRKRPNRAVRTKGKI